jgi:hypothetical protein
VGANQVKMFGLPLQLIEGRANKNPLQSALCLGTRRFQRAVSASRPIAFQCASCRDGALEAARTQDSLADLCRGFI